MMGFRFEDTIVAPATVPGAGALSVIRLSGPSVYEVLDKTISFKKGDVNEFRPYTIHFGSILREDGAVLDDVLVSVFRAPHSYTGEDSAEISCHASAYIVSEALRLLTGAGARPAGPGEFTKRAFLNGKMDLAQAEAVADLISARDEASRRVAFSQLRGGVSSELKHLRDKLLELTALMELELDFSEEDVEFADRDRLSALLDEAIDRVSSLADSFRAGNAIRNGVPVVIAGAPNTGKSTLLNALLGDERAIVSDIPGTTRDTVEDVVNIGGVSFRFIDTAGLRETQETVEKMGIERSLQKLGQASLVLAVVDADGDPETVRGSLEEIAGALDLGWQKSLVLINKIDKLSDNKKVSALNKLVSSIDGRLVCMEISAKEGIGLPAVKNWLADSQKGLLAHSDDTVLVTNVRHFNALRESLSYLLKAREGLACSRPSDLVAQDLRDAINPIGAVIGDSITPDETLGLIFSRFCIGK
jgi:tRNA modification GTPase